MCLRIFLKVNKNHKILYKRIKRHRVCIEIASSEISDRSIVQQFMLGSFVMYRLEIEYHYINSDVYPPCTYPN